MKKFLLNHLESIVISSFSIIFTLLFWKFGLIYTLDIYPDLNQTFIGLFGGLLGLLLTAYAIVFGIVPTLNKELLESDSFLRINKTFFGTVILTLILLVSSIVFEFLSEKVRYYFLIGFFLIFSMELMGIILITIILFLLLKISRKKILGAS